MNGDAAERLGDGRHRADDVAFIRRPDFMERDRAVLALAQEISASGRDAIS